jgi:hypothetical protein
MPVWPPPCQSQGRCGLRRMVCICGEMSGDASPQAPKSLKLHIIKIINAYESPALRQPGKIDEYQPHGRVILMQVTTTAWIRSYTGGVSSSSLVNEVKTLDDVFFESARTRCRQDGCRDVWAGGDKSKPPWSGPRYFFALSPLTTWFLCAPFVTCTSRPS